MKSLINVSICLVLILFACSKPDKKDLPPTPIAVADSAMGIYNVQKNGINEFTIYYYVKPPANEPFSSISLCWSTSQDFVQDSDSVNVAPTPGTSSTYNLTRLKQTTKYYGRLGITYKGKRFYSQVSEWTTDTFKVINFYYKGLKTGVGRTDSALVNTNLPSPGPNFTPEAKVFLGNYECPVLVDAGHAIRFHIPAIVPFGKYILKVQARGMEASLKDSVEVLRGKWSFSTPAPIPPNPGIIMHGLINYGTCASAQKGYIVGGAYLYGLPNTNFPESKYPDYLLEFDGAQQTWATKKITNVRYFDNPICYYYNNSIYVLGAYYEYFFGPFGIYFGKKLRKMPRLDLATMTWTDLDSLPYPPTFSMTSFELNGEWYIGSGIDSAKANGCCGDLGASKKFWKYNPATNTWKQIADFPGSFQHRPTSFSLNSKGYVFSGYVPQLNTVGQLYGREFWEYDPLSNTWSNIPISGNDAPPLGEKYSIVTYNNRAYFLTAQAYFLALTGYEYMLERVFKEWDPTNPSVYKNVTPSDYGDVLKCLFNSGNKFYFQTDAMGFYQQLNNRVYVFTAEQ